MVPEAGAQVARRLSLSDAPDGDRAGPARGGRLTRVDPDELDRLRAALPDLQRVGLVVLFGSCAKGSPRADSDLDVAILPSGPLSAADEADLEDALGRAGGRTVDLTRLDRTDDVVLRREIARGLLLHEGQPGVFARFRADAMLEWLDLEPVYLDAQARYLKRVAGGGAG